MELLPHDKLGPEPIVLVSLTRNTGAAGLVWSVCPRTRNLTHSLTLAPAQKQLRKSPTSVEVQAIYYVMEGVIYQAPTVQKLIKSRLNKFTHHLNNAFGKSALRFFCALV